MMTLTPTVTPDLWEILDDISVYFGGFVDVDLGIVLTLTCGMAKGETFLTLASRHISIPRPAAQLRTKMEEADHT